MASVLAVGTGIAAAAFFVGLAPLPAFAHPLTSWYSQGRAATIAWRRSRGGVGAMGQAFYKGGFEPRMNRKEASLILSLK